jgi:preprotein translocase subunit SecE
MNASVESESSSNGFDIFKWIAVVALFGGMVVLNNMFPETSDLIRAGVFVVVTAICLGVASTTEKGKTFLVFAKDSRVEVRKVVWPSRQEATHTTMIIGAATAMVGVLLYFLDMFLMWAVGFVTGLRF